MEAYKTRLRTDSPDISIDSLEIIGEGWDHTAVEVNDSIIFRMPRGVYEKPENHSKVRYETDILKRLGKDIPVAIPNPLYIAPKQAYFGYPKLEGELLNDIQPSFDFIDNKRLKEDWVTIAHAVHVSISREEAQSLNIPPYSYRRSLSNAQKIYDVATLDRPTKAFVDSVLEKASTLDLSSEPLTFIHNDLHFLNILSSPISKRITGVIDWSDICFAPLSREFSIWGWGSDNDLEEVASIYEARTSIKVGRAGTLLETSRGDF